VGASAALHAGAEAVIDLAQAHLLSGRGERETNLLVAEHIARTDDHDLASASSGIVPRLK
jgi:hypothetical protein